MMKTKLLIIIAVTLLLLPWIRRLDVDVFNQIMIDGITTSAITVMSITIIFSLVSWVLFAWATKNIKFTGLLLAVITSTSLVIPFFETLGPMAAIIIGVVAGFTAFMLQKKMTNPTQNKSLIIATITIVASYLVLTIIMLLLTNTLHVWDTGDGISAWSGTAEGMAEQSISSVLFNNLGFIFFPVIIPLLIITGLIIRDKKNEN